MPSPSAGQQGHLRPGGTQSPPKAPLRTVMSFGFGGTNATLVFRAA